MPVLSWLLWLAIAAPIPLLLRRLVLTDGILTSSRWLQIATAFQPYAAVCLIAGGAILPPGIWRAATALPWAVVMSLCAIAGAQRFVSTRVLTASDLALSAGLVFAAIGAFWVLIDALELRPLGFDLAIVRLTAIHFLYAGIALPILTAWSAKRVGGRSSAIACWGVILGVPLTSLGSTLSQLHLSTIVASVAAVVTAVTGAIAASLQWRVASMSGTPRVARGLLRTASVALGIGVLFASAYGLRDYLQIDWLGVPSMSLIHGVANAIGFALPAAWAWQQLD